MTDKQPEGAIDLLIFNATLWVDVLRRHIPERATPDYVATCFAQIDSAREELAKLHERTFPIQQSHPIPWSLAEKAYREYARRCGTSQSLERLAQRGGFHVEEMDMFVPNWREELCEINQLRAENKRLLDYWESSPIPMILTCPMCCERHIDEGEFATKVHHTHSCQACGFTWRPAIVPTVGVKFLPGFKNET